MIKKIRAILFSIIAFTSFSEANTAFTTVYATSGTHSVLGRVEFTDSPYGLLIQPRLKHLKPGLHGFHLHQYPDCGKGGKNAGGHFDPKNTKRHRGPYDNGHLGDLPVLYVDKTGSADVVISAPRLKVCDLTGLSLMVHASGDNYSDDPPLGGGGGRVACGIIHQG